jgi:hypothetical protein
VSVCRWTSRIDERHNGSKWLIEVETNLSQCALGGQITGTVNFLTRRKKTMKARLAAYFFSILAPLLMHYQHSYAADTDRYETIREHIEARGSVSVLVTLAVEVQPESKLAVPEKLAQRARIVDAQKNLRDVLDGLDATVLKNYTILPLALVRVDLNSFDALKQSNIVGTIREDGKMTVLDADTDAVMHVPEAWAAGYDGAGWSIVVIDEGVQEDHPFFAGRIVGEACFTGAGLPQYATCPNGQNQQTGPGAAVDCGVACPHGTLVSGVALGNGLGSGGPGYAGVAIGASLVAIQITTIDHGSLLLADSDILSALEWVHTDLVPSQTVHVAAVNMSFGTSGSPYMAPCDDDAANYKLAIDTLRGDGIPAIISSGNDSFTEGIDSPACVSSAISVGATDNLDAVASFSDSAYFMSLFAPGVMVNTSTLGSAYTAANGTSLAAPQVSGAWAVLKSQLPAMDVTEGLRILRGSGVPIAASGTTIPRIDVGAAINYVFRDGFETQ